MNKISTVAVALVLASSSLAYASGDHDMSTMKGKGNMSMGQSDTMQAHMKTMKADMIAIHKETDPNKRKAMMKAHMKGMSSMMGTMKGERSMMKDKHMDQMKQLEIRMSMMEVMMENMVHNQVILSAPDSVFKWDETADEYQLQ
jgi:hypothetical protein